MTSLDDQSIPELADRHHCRRRHVPRQPPGSRPKTPTGDSQPHSHSPYRYRDGTSVGVHCQERAEASIDEDADVALVATV